MKKVVRYKCSYCQKLAAKATTIYAHEQECIHDPNSKNCYKCQFAVKGGYRDDSYTGSSTYVEDMPYCLLHECPLDELRYSGKTALNCSDWKPGGMYFEKNCGEGGEVTDYFGKPIDLFGGDADEDEAN